MPYGDRMGPLGTGPMTGRGAGYCSGFNRPVNMNSFRGFGFGMGFGGRGRGWRNQYYATGLPGWARDDRYLYPELTPLPIDTSNSSEEGIKILKSQSKAFENNLSVLKNRIAELEGSTGE